MRATTYAMRPVIDSMSDPPTSPGRRPDRAASAGRKARHRGGSMNELGARVSVFAGPGRGPARRLCIASPDEGDVAPSSRRFDWFRGCPLLAPLPVRGCTPASFSGGFSSADRVAGLRLRFESFSRWLAPFISRMWPRCVERSLVAPARRSLPRTSVQFAKGKFVVTSRLGRSEAWLMTSNRSSASALLAGNHPSSCRMISPSSQAPPVRPATSAAARGSQ